MKKRQTILIAAFLVILHLIILIVMIGGNDQETPTTPQPIKPTIETPRTSPPPSHEIPTLELPGLTPQTSTSTQKPISSTQSSALKTASGIGTPGTKAGYLRKDLANRRTTKRFTSLKKDPYVGAIVVDARTAKILYEDHATSYAYPASVTKMMTMLLVLEQVEQRKIQLSDMVQISKDACRVGGSQVYLDSRESFSIDDLLNALMIHSANDAAAALGIHVAGTTDAFVEQMNQKAAALGMNATTYHSPHGLPPGDGKQSDISTAHDIALLSMELLRYKDTLRYTGTELAFLPLSKIRKEEFMLATRNPLVKRVGGYQGCDGLKTGYHSAGGRSISATAEKDGERLIVVVLGCTDKNTRSEKTKSLFDKGFALLGK